MYKNRVTDCYGKGNSDLPLKYGPNIADWPEMAPLTKNLLMKVVAVIDDPVTTTDELIPSGETSSYRSNPLRLAEFALSRKRPDYVGKAKAVFEDEKKRRLGDMPEEYQNALRLTGVSGEVEIGSLIYAVKPGDGSAREQAASCQRVLGGVANFAKEYATKRYRSNLINWGMLPYLYDNKVPLECGDIVVVPDAATVLDAGKCDAYVVRGEKVYKIGLTMDPLTEEEKKIVKAGCLINRNKEKMKK